MSDLADFDATQERILAEFAERGYGNDSLSFKESMELRAYAKARADLSSVESTMEQSIWGALYAGMTEACREQYGDSVAKIDRLEAERDELRDLTLVMKAKIEARPNDYGVRVWWGFLIVGPLVGWIRYSDLETMLLYGLAFGIAGMFFCIFAIDSAEVQSRIAIFVGRLNMNRLSEWLYNRALTIR